MDENLERLDERSLRDIKERIAASPFHTWFGMRLLSVGVGDAQMVVDLDERHLNMQGIIHGGVIATVADTVIGLAVRSRLPAELALRTAHLSVNYLTEVEGGRLLVHGRTLHAGRRICHGEADVVGEGGMLTARASATFVVSPGGDP